MINLLAKLINAERQELGTTLISFIYYFLLLLAYYLIRPIRDTMGIEAGVENLHWLFTATFLTMLAIVPFFGLLTSRFTRRHFIIISYSIVILSFIGFYLALTRHIDKTVTSAAFYVWVSVFNLFIVSIFWSLMTDIFSESASKRLFPFIAAGGTSGAILGPLITGSMVHLTGIASILLIAAGLIFVAVLCVIWLTRNDASDQRQQVAMGGGTLEAIKLIIRSKYLIGICLLILLYSTTSTFLYFEQAWIVSKAVHGAESRTALFAGIDFTVNVLTLFFQVCLTSRIIKACGLAITLSIIPCLVALGFIGLSIAPVLSTIVIFQVIRRAGNYAIMRPSREALYVVLSKQEKYKAKNVIDTLVYRTGDVSSAWVYALLTTMALNVTSIALVGGFIAIIWAVVAYSLGLSYQKRVKDTVT